MTSDEHIKRPMDLLPRWIGSEDLAAARVVWEPLYGRPLTDDEVTEIVMNVTGLLRVLCGTSLTARRDPTFNRSEDDDGQATEIAA